MAGSSTHKLLNTRLLPVFSFQPAVNPTGVTFTNPLPSTVTQDAAQVNNHTPKIEYHADDYADPVITDHFTQLLDTPPAKLQNRMVFWGSTEAGTGKASLFVREALATFPKVKKLADQSNKIAHAELLFAVSNWAKAVRQNPEILAVLSGLFLSNMETLEEILLKSNELGTTYHELEVADDAELLLKILAAGPHDKTSLQREAKTQGLDTNRMGWESVLMLREMISATEAVTSRFPKGIAGEDKAGAPLLATMSSDTHPQQGRTVTERGIEKLMSQDSIARIMGVELLSSQSVLGKIAYLDDTTEITRDDINQLKILAAKDETIAYDIVNALAYGAATNPDAVTALLAFGSLYHGVHSLLEKVDIDFDSLLNTAEREHGEATSLLFTLIILCERVKNEKTLEFADSIGMGSSMRDRYIWALKFLIDTENREGFNEFLDAVKKMAQFGDEAAKSLYKLGPDGLIDLLGLNSPDDKD